MVSPNGDEEVPSQGGQPMLASQRAKANGTDSKPKSRMDSFFPLGYKQGFSQWWGALPAAKTEHNVLSYIPYLQKPPTHIETGATSPNETTVSENMNQPVDNVPVTKVTSQEEDPYGPRKWFSRMVPLSGKNRALNEFSIERVGETPENNLVILHGYGAGLGFFYKNFEGLSRMQGWQLYALDLLGMGRSSRPPFKIRSKQRMEQITEAETFFIDALEEWRIKKKLDRFTLVGHSLGGYLAVAYALKYPGHLNKLILASPVGIPEDPYAVKAAMPEPQDSTMANEFTQDQDLESTTNGEPNGKVTIRKNTDSSQKSRQSSDDPPPRRMPKWVVYLWDANISPFSFVRWAGPLGPRLVSGWTSRRFSHLAPEEAKTLHDYSYSLFRLRGSGEYALSYILAPGAFARNPLIHRIQGVGRQPLTVPSSELSPSKPSSTPSGQPHETGVPITFLYGTNDWMDVNGGRNAAKKLQAEQEKALANATPEEKERENGDAKVILINDAGHHVYLDNAEEFNDVIREEMKDVERREKRLKALEGKQVNGAA